MLRWRRKRKRHSVKFLPTPWWWLRLGGKKLSRTITVFGILFFLSGAILSILSKDLVLGLVLSMSFGMVLTFRQWLNSRWCFVNQLRTGKTPFHEMTPRQFEQFIAELFVMQGFKCRLTPATGDYGLDVIAQKKGERLGIQCKMYTGSVGVSAIQQAVSGSLHYQCTKAVAITTSYFTRQAQVLAKSNNCQLISGTKLAEMIQKHQK